MGWGGWGLRLVLWSVEHNALCPSKGLVQWEGHPLLSPQGRLYAPLNWGMAGPSAGTKEVPFHLLSVNPGPDLLERMLSLRLRCVLMLSLLCPHTLSIQSQPHEPINASPSSLCILCLPRVQDFIYSSLIRASPDLCSRYTCRSSPHAIAWDLEMQEPIPDPSFLSPLLLGHLSLEQWRQAAERTGWEKGQRGEGKKCSCVLKHTSLSTFKMSQHSIKRSNVLASAAQILKNAPRLQGVVATELA